jgi:hypothetical protein
MTAGAGYGSRILGYLLRHGLVCSKYGNLAAAEFLQQMWPHAASVSWQSPSNNVCLHAQHILLVHVCTRSVVHLAKSCKGNSRHYTPRSQSVSSVRQGIELTI